MFNTVNSTFELTDKDYVGFTYRTKSLQGTQCRHSM